MDPLKAAGLCVLLDSPQQANQTCAPVVPVTSPLVERWETLISEAARRFAVPEGWIRAVMRRESGGRTMLNGLPITASAGAMGLMQLMPGTYADMRVRYGFGPDPFDAHDNILAGAAYLREMLDRYGYPNLFAAYHAGPGRMDAFLAGEKLLPDATLTYLESIVPGVEIVPFSTRNPVSKTTKSSPNSLFFVQSEDKNSSLELSNPNSISAKFESKASEIHRENARGKIVEPVRGEDDLFVPLTQPAR